MKIMKRNVILPILFFLLIGCSTTTNLKLVDSSGRELPNPHYALTNLSTNLTAMFYYVSMSEIKDTDGTIIYRPTYLPMHKVFKAVPTSKLHLIIEVSNPNKIEYNVWSESMTTCWEKYRGKYTEIFAGSLLAKSRVEYRQFIFDIPVSEKIKDVTYGVNLLDKTGNILMYFGDFHYQIEKKEVIDNLVEIF